MTTLDLDTLILEHGSHTSPEHGMCVMEAVAYVAGEPHSDHPKCASRVLTNLLIGLNDRWNANDRQLLKPYIPKLVGTNTGEADEETRRWMITDWLVHEYAPAIFRHVGLTAEAEEFEQFAAITSASEWASIRSRIYAVRDEQWKRRSEARERLRKQAVADADAVAVADAAADAVADAVVDAAAAAEADVAVAVAVAAAVAAAVADAAAAAAADAAAAAAPFKDAIDAAIEAKKKGAGYNGQWQAAYNVMRPYYDQRYSEVFGGGELGLKQSALQLVERLIEVGKA